MFSIGNDRSDLIEFSYDKRKENYNYNYSVLFKLNRENIGRVKVENGKFVPCRDPLKNQKEVKELILQIVRETLGRIVDAHHGQALLSEELFKLNQLKDHLIRVFPEFVESCDLTKSMQIFSQTYGTPSKQVHNTIQLLGQQNYKTLENSYRSCLREENNQLRLSEKLDRLKGSMNFQEGLSLLKTKKEEITHKITEKQQLLEHYLLKFEDLSSELQGLTPARFHVLEGNGQKCVVEKDEKDEELALAMGRIYRIDEKNLHFLGGFHEVLMSSLNLLLQGRLNIPLVIKNGKKTSHAHLPNIGSFKNFCNKLGFKEALSKLPLQAAQRVALTNIISRNFDAHGSNILINYSSEPVAIDFGRILSHKFPLQGSYFCFPGLDEPLNDQDAAYFLRVDYLQIIEELTKILMLEYPEAFLSPSSSVVGQELELLKARLCMVQKALRANLTLRQIIALDLPPLSPSIIVQLKTSFECTQSHQDLEELFAAGLKKKVEEHRQSVGFEAAWSKSFNYDLGEFDLDSFKKEIRKEISDLKKKEYSSLYGWNEGLAYSLCGYDRNWHSQVTIIPSFIHNTPFLPVDKSYDRNCSNEMQDSSEEC